MLRKIWIVLGAVAVATVSYTAAFAVEEVVTESPLQLHYVYRGKNIRLHLDGSRLTVLFDKPLTPARRSAALEHVLLARDRVVVREHDILRPGAGVTLTSSTGTRSPFRVPR